jgi:hypothetical protein
LELWIGPVIIAAAVSALVSVAGWFVTFQQSIGLEKRRRAERVHDFQVALRAEIASDRLALVVVDRDAFLDEIKALYMADPTYSVLVPHSASNTIFASIIKEIHVLPGDVIGPVVDYARLRETIERFVEDMRGERFRTLSPERQLLIYTDYLKMLERLEVLADNALVAINRSLNIPAEDPPSQSSALGRGEAPAEPGGALDEKRDEA